MTLAEIDWTVLRRPAVVLMVSLAISATVLSGAHYYSSEVEREYLTESRRLASARSRYLALDDEKRLINEYYPQYVELERQGRIGEEQRLNWVETLRTVASHVKLPSLQYEIGAQQPFEPDFPLPAGRFDVLASEMNLTIGLFHEEDLPRMLDELSRRAAGLFTVTSCQVRRLQETFQEDPTKANLEADCRLRWYTVKPSEEPEAPARGRRPARRGP